MAWNIGIDLEARTSLNDLVRVNRTILDHGAYADGEAVDNTAVTEMATQFGYVVFPPGATRLSTITISVPIYFLPGAYITAIAGQTITINRQVQSPKQWIFRGDGTYSLGHDSNGGEDAREVHISWFGAFPYPGTSVIDHGAIINKASAAMGNSRESVIHFDVGNYTIASEISLTRGCWLKGAGTRRTVFRSATDGFTAVTSNGNAVKLSDLQFENWGVSPRTSPWVFISHTDCEIYNVDMGESLLGIVTVGENTRIFNIRAIYGASPGSGSSLVEIRGGGQSRVDGIMIGTSGSYGPETIVRVGGPNQSATVSAIGISNITAKCPAQIIMFQAFGGNISRCTVDNIRYNASSGTVPNNSITLKTSSTYVINDITMDGVVESYSANGIRLEQTSSGRIEDISLDNISISGASGHGLEFVRTNGEIRRVTVGSGVNVKERATPFFYDGSNISVAISPLAQKGANTVVTYDLGNIDDDGVAQIPFQHQVFAALVFLVTNLNDYGTFSARLVDTRRMTPIQASADIETATTVLTGTTGTDGKLTISAADGTIYVENRTGTSLLIQVTVMTGSA
jgi:hypothetical protein